jgi:surfeit locus 1 family protein
MSSRVRLLILAGLLLVTAVCVRLGFWQLGRLQERRAGNSTAAAALAEPEVDLSTAAAAAPYRRVRVTGEYDHAHDIVVRGQAYREQPGVTVVSPLRIRGTDRAVLVARGFVAAADAVTAGTDSLREPGVVEVRGVAMPLGSRPDSGQPLERHGRTTWKGLDRAALEARTGYRLGDVYVLQTPDSALPRTPRRLPPPSFDDGPHLSYAIQWFAFATIAVVGGTVLLGSRPRSSG